MAAWGWLVGLAVVVAGPVLAEPLRFEIAGVGEVAAQDLGDGKLLPGNLAEVTGVSTPLLLHPGTRITGAYCHQFGFSFRAANLPPGEVAMFTVHVSHPRWTLPDGRTGTDEQWTSAIEAQKWGYVGYSFTEPWSLEAGTWVFTLTQGPRVLAEQRFEVEVAPGQAMPSQGCVPSVS